MLSSCKPWMTVLGAAVAVLALSAPVPAAPTAGAPVSASDLGKLLPNDTEAVVVVNFKQLFQAPLLKKGGALEALKEALQNNDDAKKTMADLGIDPFKDVTALIMASSGDDPDKGLTVLQGTFDVSKFQAKAEEVAKDKKDNLKIQKVKVGADEYTVYELAKLDELIKLPAEFAALADGSDAKTLFVGVDKSALLMSASKESVAEALAKAAGKKKTELKSKDMQSLLAKIDPKQTVSVALLAGTLAKGPLAEDSDAKDALAKLDNVTGGITVADGIKTQILLAAKSDDDAKDLNKRVDEGLRNAESLVGFVVDQRKDLAPLLTIIKGVKASAAGKTVTIESDIAGEVVQDLAKTLGQMIHRSK
jgi:hypothetical protein